MNEVSYFEIQANNPEEAIKFYSEVFGWEFELDPTLPIEYYRITNAGPFGGLLKRELTPPPPKTAPNAFVNSIHVENFDKASEKIQRAGGRIIVEKIAIKGKCYQGYFLDNQGNIFGIFEVDNKAT